MSFRKDDADKPRIHLLPIEALLGAARAMGHGADKYGADNYRKDAAWNRYYDAVQRHMLDWQLGKEIDDGPKGSGLPIIDHAAASVLILSWLEKTGTGLDDRWFPEEPEEPIRRNPKRRKRT
jgi:hypothetical protein